jgi:quercetin dioxygenase-like cupin family protein
VSADDTGGTYSILEQLLAREAGPPPHVHQRSEEVFYVLDGTIRVQLGESVFDAQAGQLIRVPAGVPHGFAVLSETARFLNFYSPAAVDRMIAMLGTPARGKRLPTQAEQQQATEQRESAYRAHLVGLDSQVWSDQADLLIDSRASSPGAGAGGPKRP